MKKLILLLVFNRPEKTKLTLQALRRLKAIENFELLIIRQEGCDEVKHIVNGIDWIKNTHVVTNFNASDSVKYRINFNMHQGLSIAFDKVHADYVIVIEDDILLGYDFLVFCDEIHQKFFGQSKFRAINAFSAEEFSEKNISKYGLFRFGVGKGWSINKDVWRKLKSIWVEPLDAHFDCIIEPWIRGGFVVMPYCSRSYDIGWGNSSHTPVDQHHEYYTRMKNSFVGSKRFPIQNYSLDQNIRFLWRSDCVHFKSTDLKNLQSFCIWRIKFYIKAFIKYIS